MHRFFDDALVTDSSTMHMHPVAWLACFGGDRCVGRTMQPKLPRVRGMTASI
jgi:hypothetical protein